MQGKERMVAKAITAIDTNISHILGCPNYEIADVTFPIALDAGNLRGRERFKLPTP
jgi:hypothetical protein